MASDKHQSDGQPYAHLHVHTEYSMLDGAARLKELFKEVKSLGMTHVAMTDHGNMFAADGIDELIMGFGQRRKYRPEAGPGGILRVTTDDTGDGWQARLADGRVQAAREPAGRADCVVSGAASAMYLFLWHRGGEEDITVSGDRAVLDQWKQGVRVRWG